jgi:hypothetical protein
MKNRLITIALLLFFQGTYAQKHGKPLVINTQKLRISLDASTCRWSAQVKGTEMAINNVHFLPNDDPSGWKVTGSVNNLPAWAHL